MWLSLLLYKKLLNNSVAKRSCVRPCNSNLRNAIDPAICHKEVYQIVHKRRSGLYIRVTFIALTRLFPLDPIFESVLLCEQPFGKVVVGILGAIENGKVGVLLVDPCTQRRLVMIISPLESGIDTIEALASPPLLDIVGCEFVDCFDASETPPGSNLGVSRHLVSVVFVVIGVCLWLGTGFYA